MGPTHVVLVGILAVAASQGTSPKPESPPPVPESELVPPGKSPYSRIFPAPPQDPRSRNQAVPLPQSANPDTQPRVVCGTVVVPVKPDADSRMIVRPPKDGPQPDYKIRKIAPRICNE
jgi:hypothetical protein